MSKSVAAIFSEVLKVPESSITDETSPENTPAWDSLTAIDLVNALEEAFSIRLSTKEILSMRTVGIVRKVLKGKGVQEA